MIVCDSERDDFLRISRLFSCNLFEFFVWLLFCRFAKIEKINFSFKNTTTIETYHRRIMLFKLWEENIKMCIKIEDFLLSRLGKLLLKIFLFYSISVLTLPQHDSSSSPSCFISSCVHNELKCYELAKCCVIVHTVLILKFTTIQYVFFLSLFSSSLVPVHPFNFIILT